MNLHSHVEATRLHCEHLRTLLDQCLINLTTIGYELAKAGNSSSAIVAAHLNGLEKQSGHLAVELVRLQEFVSALKSKSTEAFDGAVESHQASCPPSDTPGK
jgi:hypothetical protein